MQPGQPSALVSWDDFNFPLHEKFRPVCRDEYVTWYCLSLVQIDFSYSSAIITLNSAFILGLSDSKSNPITAICDL